MNTARMFYRIVGVNYSRVIHVNYAECKRLSRREGRVYISISERDAKILVASHGMNNCQPKRGWRWCKACPRITNDPRYDN